MTVLYSWKTVLLRGVENDAALCFPSIPWSVPINGPCIGRCSPTSSNTYDFLLCIRGRLFQLELLKLFRVLAFLRRLFSQWCWTGWTRHQISPDGTTLYAAGYANVPPPAVDASPSSADVESSQQIPAAIVWRYEMQPSERQAMAALALRMDAFQGGQIYQHIPDLSV